MKEMINTSLHDDGYLTKQHLFAFLLGCLKALPQNVTRDNVHNLTLKNSEITPS